MGVKKRMTVKNKVKQAILFSLINLLIYTIFALLSYCVMVYANAWDTEEYFPHWIVMIFLSAFISVGVTRIIENEFKKRKWVSEMEKELEELKKRMDEGKMKIFNVVSLNDNEEIEVSNNMQKLHAKGKGKLYTVCIFIPDIADEKEVESNDEKM